MKQRIYPGLICLAAIVLLAGCSTTPNCLEPQPYMQAEQLPPLESPPGLDVPKPDPDMAIPQVGDGPIGRYEQIPESRADTAFAHCLIAPPPIPRG